MRFRSLGIAVLFVSALSLQSCSSFMNDDEFEMPASSSNEGDVTWEYEANSVEGKGYQFVKRQNPQDYTVQLAVGKKADLVAQKLIDANINCNPVHYYMKQGKDVVKGVSCGSFRSLAEAHNFRAQLPDDINSDLVGVYQWRVIQKRVVPY